MKTFLKFSLIPLLLHALTSHAALTVTNIARGFGAQHSLFLKSDGSLWAMGENQNGALGDGAWNDTNRPQQIVASNVTAIAAGAGHSLFIKSDGSLWAMGYNGDGELGDGTYATFAPQGTNRPEQIVPSGVTAVAAGYDHSLFLKSDGSLWGMGENQYGELGGGGTFNTTNRPEQIVASGVTAIAAGDEDSLFLKSDGSLWAMGDNDHGELGDGGTFSTNRPEQIVASGVTAIAAGGFHNLFLKSNGSLWVMGLNDNGQLGDGTAYQYTNRPEQIVASGVTAIAAGSEHSLFLKSDGSLWAMGDNQYGALGDGTFRTGYPYGTNRPEQIVAGGVTAIAAGSQHSLFLKSNGSLWAVGRNFNGQLGDGFIDVPPNYGTAIPEQIFPLPPPVLVSAISSTTNIQIKATTGFGGKFNLQTGTNINSLLSQGTPLRTNSITTRGTNNYSVTVTNAVKPGGGQFYILLSQ
jgi:alpha-tubulin suppressor-like RCC1 family protein